MKHTHTHSGILWLSQEERKPAVCDNMNEPRRHNVKWNECQRKINTELYHLYVESEEAELTEAESKVVVKVG